MSDYYHENIKIENDIPVKFFSYTMPNLFVPSHWHNSLEIIFVLSGTMFITINDKRYTLSETECFIVNSGDIHSTRTDTDTHIQVLQIPYPLLKQSIPDYDKLSFRTPPAASELKSEASPLLPIFCQLQHCYESKSLGYMLRFNSLLYELLYILVNQYSFYTDNTANIKNNQNKQRLVTIMTYIKKHYKEPLSLEEVSALVSLNPEYFCRFFKRYTGTTFLEYLGQIRLSHIEKDLLISEEPITKLLEQHGFTNYKLFIRLFREKHGTTPNKYKKQIEAADKTK